MNPAGADRQAMWCKTPYIRWLQTNVPAASEMSAGTPASRMTTTMAWIGTVAW